MDPILLQKQLRDNATDLQDFCKDLKSWGEDMKRKEDSLKKPATENKTKPKKLKPSSKGKTVTKIGSTDYAKWDKFDADAECVKLEEDVNEDSELTDELDETSRDEALLQKEKGNKYVKQQKWKEAINCYTAAIDCYSYDPIFYANRALCYLRIGEMNKAENDCNLSLKLDNTYVKAYQRRAAAREALNKLSEAKQDLLKVLQLEPKNSESKISLDILRTKMGEYVKPPDLTEQRPISKFTASRKHTPDNKIIDTSKSTDWQNDSDVIIVKPTRKPPHMRSKKPLKRIPIVEKDTITSPIIPEKPVEAVKTVVIERTAPQEKSTSFPKPNTNITTLKSDDLQVIEKFDTGPECITKDEKNICNDKKLHEIKNQAVVLTIPKNAVQFNHTWNNLKTTAQKYEFLKLLEPSELPKIFQEALESDCFSELLDVMVKHFIDNNNGVYDVLRYLTEVKRFSMLAMFMTGADKNNLRKLLDYATEVEQKSKEDIDNLICKFEL